MHLHASSLGGGSGTTGGASFNHGSRILIHHGMRGTICPGVGSITGAGAGFGTRGLGAVGLTGLAASLKV